MCIFANQLWPERRQPFNGGGGSFAASSYSFPGILFFFIFYLYLFYLFIFFPGRSREREKENGGQKAVAFGYIIISSPFFPSPSSFPVIQLHTHVPDCSFIFHNIRTNANLARRLGNGESVFESLALAAARCLLRR